MSRIVLLLVVLSGCAAPRAFLPGSPAPRPLAEVNEDLRGAVVQILFTDGTRIDRAESVRVRQASTDYTTTRSGTPTRRSVPTAEVARIVAVRGRSSGAGGAMLGALPGALLAVGSALAQPSPEAPGGTQLAETALLTIGVGAGLTFAVIGGVIGGSMQSRASPGEYVVIYQGPVDRYLLAPPTR